MASFVTHGMVGAAGTALVFAYGNVPPEQSVIGTVVGGIVGTLPDTADWIASKLFGKQRWVLYEWMHTGDLVWLGFLLPPILWHQLLDIPFHQRPGEAWWPRLWWLEVVSFLASLNALLFIFNP